jgi:hypothetical protein
MFARSVISVQCLKNIKESLAVLVTITQFGFGLQYGRRMNHVSKNLLREMDTQMDMKRTNFDCQLRPLANSDVEIRLLHLSVHSLWC